ncbi:MAG: tRNA uridine-5-carboxymethylaminomethyl(34) synthesis enzyme MnmG [Bacteroidales bacterium]|nr:tRNA uridine-5-carboxymethylaminomethyl(34) synthesis enzyme MnmG [Bacteroidales bacterium]
MAMDCEEKYDVIVVGGGHAGCEAARAAAILGSSTLLISMNLNLFAAMSCNPAIGGIAKGQIVREIDALGGMTGVVADRTTLQFRMLNRSKGPAMWSPRSQNDKYRFSEEWKNILMQTPRLDFREDTVTELLVEKDGVKGVVTKLGKRILAQAVVLSNGTFLNGKIHIGETNFAGGRIGEMSAHGLTENLRQLGFESDRLKTGTPVRIDGRTVDFSRMEEQKGDEESGGFSHTHTPSALQQKSCWITYTNPTVHDILRSGFAYSPMFQGRIQGVGPRYCPSIEDKIERFAGKDQHQLFLEPESESGISYYLNGFSSSLPEAVQVEAMHRIPGLEKAKILKPGYAIEYDYFPPTQLKANLETKNIRNLFFAGQINGTTGYEEAACQGLMAGINAHQNVTGKEAFILKRNEAYIGVLIDDLITKGVDEPYRMFTSRAEHRILLRQDNADLRLTALGHQLGLVSKERNETVIQKKRHIAELTDFLRQTAVTPEEAQAALAETDSPAIGQKTKIAQLLLRPEIHLDTLIRHLPWLQDYLKENAFRKDEWEETEIEIKYSNYIEKEQETAAKITYLENIRLRPDFDYFSVQSLSTEARQKLSRIRPETLGQASRISGISPSDISVLLVLLGR